jgi:hypothetical protein
LNRNFRLRTYFWPALVCAALLLWGCQAQEAPLSPAAATFKKEIKSCLDTLAVPLLEPVANKDVGTIATTLEKAEPQTVKLCRMCPFQIGILNSSGETLAVHPPTKETKNFSSYNLVIKVINSKKIQQQRFFLQDGAQLYIICAPLIRQATVIGLMVIAISSDEAQKRWGLTEKEFLALNFNT